MCAIGVGGGMYNPNLEGDGERIMTRANDLLS
jgi:hypothetical protein